MHQLSEEEAMLLSMVNGICEDVIAVRAAAIDAEDEFPEDVFRLLAGQGLFSLVFDETYGGNEVSMNCWVNMIERISRESPAVALMIVISAIGSDALVRSGTEEQRREILPKLSQGTAKICFALTEPNAGSDISSIATVARADGEGYLINGSKIFITNGAVGDYFTVFAKVDVDGEPKPTCFIVSKDTPGLVIGRKEDKVGLRGSVTSQLFFENMKVGKDALVGEVGEGFEIAHHTLNRGRLAVAALATGVTAASLSAATAYVKERKQGGKHLSDFQAVRFMLADMAIGLENSRLLLDEASEAYEDGSVSMMRIASTAKVYCSEEAVKAAGKAVQIFGGYGLCKDYPVERYYRDAKAFTIIEGTSEIQRSLIAHAVLKGI